MLDIPIDRSVFLADAAVSDLPVLKFANATNYHLDDTLAERLAEMVAAAPGRDVAREKLFFFTAASSQAADHLRVSLIAGIPLDRLAELENVMPRLRRHARENRVFAWGARPGQAAEEKWNRLNPGDVCLVYAAGNFQLWGRVYAKTRSREVAQQIWGDNGEQTWDCMYFLDPVEELGASREDVVVALGYSPNYVPQGFEIPATATQDAIRSKFPSLAVFVDSLRQGAPPVVPSTRAAPELPTAYVEPPFQDIKQAVQQEGLRISERTLRRYHLGLKTRGFVVLAGISGSGKTWLAEAYAAAVGAQRLLMAVAPNSTTNEDLLGYRSPIDDQYRHTPFSRFLIEASEAYSAATVAGVAPAPFHLILDEMNLARVEYYFAKLLSAMEVRARGDTTSLELAPDLHVQLTPNLYFVGTVNVDETTFGFADKVYDRAQLVTIPVERQALEAHLGNAPYASVLLEIHGCLENVAPFAFRVLDEVQAYVEAANAIGTPWEEAFDEQLDQKVLPKIKCADTTHRRRTAALRRADR